MSECLVTYSMAASEQWVDSMETMIFLLQVRWGNSSSVAAREEGLLADRDPKGKGSLPSSVETDWRELKNTV